MHIIAEEAATLLIRASEADSAEIAREIIHRDGIVEGRVTSPSFDRMLFSVIPSVASHSPKELLIKELTCLIPTKLSDKGPFYRVPVFRTRRADLGDDYCRPII